jgi:Ca2+-transporting ATPase
MDKLHSSPWILTKEACANHYQTDPAVGLSSEEAKKRLDSFGKNILKEEKKNSALVKFLSQFKSPVVVILVLATMISALLSEFTDAIAIFSIVIINSIIGYAQEAKAEEAVEALRKLSAPKGRVLRNGLIHEISSSHVVPGDILILESGDYVSSDARLIDSSQLQIDEAILTGESLPVKKIIEALSIEVPLSEQMNMLFASTVVVAGSARAIVTATGMRTEIGKISEMLKTAEVGRTPLQDKLEEVSNKLLIFCGIVVVAVALLGLLHEEYWFNVLMSAIGLAVAAIPEGLPTVVTLALALAIRRLTKRNAIVKHLHAVETLGSTNVICTDKTGTLTTGKMRVRDFFTLNESDSSEALEAAILCNNAGLGESGETGDPTEVALLYLGKDHGKTFALLSSTRPRIRELSFDSLLRRMSVIIEKSGESILYIKGAPEVLLPLCENEEAEKEKIMLAIEQYTSQGRRLLLLAKRKLDPLEINLERDFLEMKLTFLGLVAIADPPREESIPAILECRKAGIKVVMITGDHPATAKTIAKELGITIEGKFDQVLTGVELEKMTILELEEHIEKIAIYARVSPEHKLKIVKAWQNKGHIVAMTGDGVNDAPALKQASVGVAMGKGGTEVAKQAASMILTDDNFATIVKAIEEGRAIYGNVRRTIQYLLSGNLAEILIMLGAAILGWPSPLAPIHLLWINLVTDGLPSLALAAEPVPENVLQQTTKPSPGSFFDKNFYTELIIVGVLTAILSLGVYGLGLRMEDEMTARTHVFSFLVFSELFRAFACRSDKKTFFQMKWSSNGYLLLAVAVPIVFQLGLHRSKFFSTLFKVKDISWAEFLVLLALTLIPVSIIEMRKYYRHTIKHRKRGVW